MADHVAHRTLVKSPPEIWAEVSEQRTLASRLEAFGEIYFSTVNPGVVKGWHLHHEMTLHYAVPVGMIKLVCYDDRETSPTRGNVVELHIGDRASEIDPKTRTVRSDKGIDRDDRRHGRIVRLKRGGIGDVAPRSVGIVRHHLQWKAFLGGEAAAGGLGDDTFVFRAGQGADTITDFSPLAASNNDVVQLVGFGASFDSFVEIIAVATQVGADTVLDFGGGQTLTLQSVTLGSLTAGDFMFGP